MTVLITGVTGSFGTSLLYHLLATTTWTIRGLSRGELLQAQLRATLTPAAGGRVRLFLGDVRDLDRLRFACKGADLVIHAAALKHVDAGEVDPFEFAKTNVIGTQNVITACIQEGVGRAVLLSTDKACSPWNLYGNTKALAEKLWVRANGYSPKSFGTHFLAVRYGNVTGSRGSVLTVWERQRTMGHPMGVTHAAMTRFWVTLPEAVDLALWAARFGERGYLYVPSLPAYRVVNLAEAVAPGYPLREIGVRPGEKLHEELLAPGECAAAGLRRYLLPGPARSAPPLVYYGVPPQAPPTWASLAPDLPPDVRVEEGPLEGRYCSEDWHERLTAEDLRARCAALVDPQEVSV